jgi:hypothetical protein
LEAKVHNGLLIEEEEGGGGGRGRGKAEHEEQRLLKESTVLDDGFDSSELTFSVV